MNRMRILAAPKKDVHTGNPYVALLYERIEGQGAKTEVFSLLRLAFGRFDLVHFHWPQGRFQGRYPIVAYPRACVFLLCLALHRMMGGKAAWTVHNILPHDRTAWCGIFLYPRIFCGLLTHVVFLSESSIAAAEAEFPAIKELPRAVIPHGHYRDVFPLIQKRQPSKSPSRIGFLGSIKPYKQVDLLIAAFKGIQSSTFSLSIYGKPESERLRQALIAAASNDPRIRLELRHIDDSELVNIYANLDLVVLPFSEILNSGSAIMALSHNCRVLVPGKGSLVELAKSIGPEWVRTYSGDLNSSHLEDALVWVKNSTQEEATLDALNWTDIGTAHLDFFRT